MFVQVIRGKVGDAEAARRAMDRWNAELRPGATGFLGTTGGITTAGELVALARFESEEAARRNSERPEQGAWWAEMEKAYAGPVQFLDSSDIEVLFDGGSDRAGFVQVMRGTVHDRDALRKLQKEVEPILREKRPDLIGGYTAFHDDGTFTDVAYFTSEAEARENENNADFGSLLEQWMQAAPVDEYLDIQQPWFD